MKILFFTLSLSSFLFGCSSFTNEQNSLENSFYEYKRAYGTPSENLLLKKSLWETLSKSRIEKKSEFTNSLAKFPEEMIETSELKESIQNGVGCLLASGVNEGGVDMDYYITFNLIQNKWIISDVAVKYFLDDSERYLTEPVCDKNKRMTLWLDFIESN